MNRVFCYSNYYKTMKRKNSSLSSHAQIKTRNQMCVFSFAFGNSFLFRLAIPSVHFLPYIIYVVVIIFTVLLSSFFSVSACETLSRVKKSNICHDVVKFQTPASRKK